MAATIGTFAEHARARVEAEGVGPHVGIQNTGLDIVISLVGSGTHPQYLSKSYPIVGFSL